MKRIFALSILLLGTIFLTGCSRQQVDQNQSTIPVLMSDKKVQYEKCLDSEKDIFPSEKDYEQGVIIVQFSTVANNQEINDLLGSSGFEERLNVDRTKTDSIRLRVERDKQNVSSTYFANSKEEFEKYWNGLLDRESMGPINKKITDGDNEILKKISEDNQDVLDCAFEPCFLRSPGIVWESKANIINGECQITPGANCSSCEGPCYLFVNTGDMHLKNKLSKEEIDRRFGHYENVVVDYEHIFYANSIDYLMHIKVSEGEEIPWVCYLKSLDSNIIQDVYVNMTVEVGL